MIPGIILQAVIVVAAYLIGRYSVLWRLGMYIRAKLCTHTNQVPFSHTGNNICLDCQVILKPGDKRFYDFEADLKQFKHESNPN